MRCFELDQAEIALKRALELLQRGCPAHLVMAYELVEEALDHVENYQALTKELGSGIRP